MTYQLLNFKGAVVEVWERIIIFMPHFIGRAITYAYSIEVCGACFTGKTHIKVSCSFAVFFIVCEPEILPLAKSKVEIDNVR